MIEDLKEIITIYIMLFKKYKEKIISLPLPYKLYLLALFVFFLASSVSLILPKIDTIANKFMIASPLCFGSGFILWVWPLVRKGWTKPIGKLIISVAHLFILIFAMALSRELVAKAVALPAQDFDLTVYFFSLLLYIPVWIAAAAILFLIVFIIFFVLTTVITLVGSMIFHPITVFIMFKKKEFFRRFEFYRRYGNGSGIYESFLVRGCGHTVGAAVVAALLIGLLLYCYNNRDVIYGHSSQPIRYVAYLFDYKPMTNYPGTEQEERVRIHGNGVISSAKIIDSRVEIEVKRIFQKSVVPGK